MRGNIGYLLLSVSLSAGRNITSKKTAIYSNEKSSFFLSQSILFLSAALLLIGFNSNLTLSVSNQTVIYGGIYGILLILSQWMFTLALKMGSTSICSVIYSLGFLLPTLSGTLFWNEEFTFTHFVGLVIALATILLTTKREENSKQGQKTFVPFILVAMLASGGLGIMQKVQQNSNAANEKSLFLIIAFVIAFLCSMIAFLFSEKTVKMRTEMFLFPAITGVCFGGANLCNTTLAGRMKSAVFFPVQNISTILLSTVLGIVIFREKLTWKTMTIILLGITVVLIFSI